MWELEGVGVSVVDSFEFCSIYFSTWNLNKEKVWNVATLHQMPSSQHHKKGQKFYLKVADVHSTFRCIEFVYTMSTKTK